MLLVEQHIFDWSKHLHSNASSLCDFQKEINVIMYIIEENF
jgi:hypothetical protein